MKILYLSVLASQAALNDAHIKNPKFSSYAVQKFNRLVVEGLAQNGHQVLALSTFYLPGMGLFYKRKAEVENDVNYQYITAPNISPFRHLWLLLYGFFKILFWGSNNRSNKVLMCDVLDISVCIGAVAAARLIQLRRVGIVTDVPGIAIGRDDSKKTDIKRKKSFTTRVNQSYLDKFSHYVFLTEQMNPVVNVKRRPYIIMEGLVDLFKMRGDSKDKSDKKIVMYAGGLMERFGLKILVEGFIKANVDNSELWIYGSGPFAEKIEEYHVKYPNVIYKGIRPNSEVVEAEVKATLLVNPRPTNEEFTKYSFPSKNMEYMVSGTPLLTTDLPGMPGEYKSHVYIFNEGEDVDGYATVLKEILELPLEDLKKKGEEAQKWILENKNKVMQTSRIIQLVRGVLK